MSRLEGSGAARMVALMRQHGYNKDIDVETGVITSAPPSIKIRLENDGLELDSDDVVVAEHLTKHSRTVQIDGGSEVTLEFTDNLKVGDRVTILSANNGQQYYVIDKAVMY